MNWISLGKRKDIIKKLVIIIPQSMLIKSFGNQHKMFKKFSGRVFKSIIYHSDLQCHVHHIKRIHSHPACSVSLLQPVVSGHFNTSVKYADIIQSQKSSLKDIVATGIFPVDPPGKIDDKLM